MAPQKDFVQGMKEFSSNLHDKYGGHIQTAAAILTCISVVITAVMYICEGSQRKKQAVFEAWSTVNSAHGLEHSGGRIEALGYLNSENQSLAGLTTIRANLTRVQLPGADVQDAVLCVTHLEGANLKGASLNRANLENSFLEGANLEDAKLKRAMLKKVNLRNVTWKNADIEGANFYNARNIDAQKIKQAKNWDKAYYITDDLKRLGLPDKQHVFNDPRVKNKTEKGKLSYFKNWHNPQCSQK